MIEYTSYGELRDNSSENPYVSWELDLPTLLTRFVAMTISSAEDYTEFIG